VLRRSFYGVSILDLAAEFAVLKLLQPSKRSWAEALNGISLNMLGRLTWTAADVF
jgi:hypothetical protein